MNSCQTLLIDLFPGKGASITASSNLMRCILGAIATVYIDPGIEGVGMGWMFTILGLCLTANCICIPILIKYGPKWRQNRLDRQNNLKSGDDTKKASFLARLRRD
jgi:cyanate permease